MYSTLGSILNKYLVLSQSTVTLVRSTQKSTVGKTQRLLGTKHPATGTRNNALSSTE